MRERERKIEEGCRYFAMFLNDVGANGRNVALERGRREIQPVLYTGEKVEESLHICEVRRTEYQREGDRKRERKGEGERGEGRGRESRRERGREGRRE